MSLAEIYVSTKAASEDGDLARLNIPQSASFDLNLKAKTSETTEPREVAGRVTQVEHHGVSFRLHEYDLGAPKPAMRYGVDLIKTQADVRLQIGDQVFILSSEITDISYKRSPENNLVIEVQTRQGNEPSRIEVAPGAQIKSISGWISADNKPPATTKQETITQISTLENLSNTQAQQAVDLGMAAEMIGKLGENSYSPSEIETIKRFYRQIRPDSDYLNYLDEKSEQWTSYPDVVAAHKGIYDKSWNDLPREVRSDYCAVLINAMTKAYEIELPAMRFYEDDSSDTFGYYDTGTQTININMSTSSSGFCAAAVINTLVHEFEHHHQQMLSSSAAQKNGFAGQADLFRRNDELMFPADQDFQAYRDQPIEVTARYAGARAQLVLDTVWMCTFASADDARSDLLGR